jgi:hypothetical protein
MRLLDAVCGAEAEAEIEMPVAGMGEPGMKGWRGFFLVARGVADAG